MRSLEELIDLIPGYLTSALTNDEKKDFVAGLNEHPILRREVDELRELQRGLEIADNYDAGHIDDESLVSLAFSEGIFDTSEQSRIESHLDQCPRCREKYKLARGSYKRVSRDNVQWLASFRKLLFPSNLILRPAVAYAVLVFCLLPAILLYVNRERSGGGLQVLELSDNAVRGAVHENSFELDQDASIVRLQVLIPVCIDCQYDLHLIGTETGSVMQFSNLGAQSPFHVDVPRSYFSQDDYAIVITERDASGAVSDTFRLTFSVVGQN